MAKFKYFYSEAEQKRMNKIICQRIRDNIPLQDYAASRGFQLERKGKYYKIVGEKNNSDFSSVMINSETNHYKHYSIDKTPRSVIDFVMELDGCDQATAINTLKPLINTYDLESASVIERSSTPKKKMYNKPLTLPERADTIKNVYAYLTKTRCINKDIVDHFIYNDNLYQDNYDNCVLTDTTDRAILPSAANAAQTRINHFFNQYSFLERNISIVVCGAKPGEIEYSTQALGVLQQYNNVIYLFNFVAKSDESDIISQMGNHRTYFSPLIPDAFSVLLAQQKLYDEILNIKDSSALSQKKNSIFSKWRKR